MSKLLVTRLVIETKSPMAINSGRRETGYDTELARDANGLPYIPATAIAGVWRRIVALYLPEHVTTLFGSQAQASAVTVSHGVVHDSSNRPVTGLKTISSIKQDPLLAWLYEPAPMHRDHVRINDRGVAANQGKYDQILLPAGLRFSITLKLELSGEQEINDIDWQQAIACWGHRKMAFGSKTRNGLGQIEIVACETKSFDLMEGISAGADLQAFIRDTAVPNQQLPGSAFKPMTLLAELNLQALDNWRCGRGAHLLGELSATDKVNSFTYSEPRVNWTGGRAYVSKPKAVLCGSSVKGMIAHRVAYHWRRNAQIYAESITCDSEWSQRPEALQKLFGFAADDSSDIGLAGCLYIDDAMLNYEHTITRTHNHIDRFTGGVKNGALYTEELLYRPEFTLRIYLDEEELERRGGLTEQLKKALNDTVADIRSGLLPIAAGTSRGSGLTREISEENISNQGGQFV